MTDEATEIETDDDFSTDEPDAAEVLYDDGAPIEVPEDEQADDEEQVAAAPIAQDETFTVQELAVISQADQEIKQLRADEKKIADVEAALQQHGGDFVKLVGGDKDKAALLRVDFGDLKRSVRQRQDGEKAFRQKFSQHRQSKRVAAEAQAMEKAVPELANADNRVALAGWLKKQGFSQDDVNNIRSHQAVAAWGMYKKSRALKVPANGRKARKPQESRKEDGEIISPGRQFANEFYGTTPKRQKSTTELLRERRKGESWDDAASVLYA